MKGIRKVTFWILIGLLAASSNVHAITAGLPITSQYGELHYVFPALARVYNRAQINQSGYVDTEVKLRGKTKAAAAAYINHKQVWLKLRIQSSDSDNFRTRFRVKSGDLFEFAEVGGNINRVCFIPDSKPYLCIPLQVTGVYSKEVIPAQVVMRRFNSNAITRPGKITVKVKMRAGLGVMVVKINGNIVQKYWRLSGSSRNVVRDYRVSPGDRVEVGEVGGKIEYVIYYSDY